MPIHARNVGNNLLYYLSSNRQRLVDAIGPDVVKFEDDFVHHKSTAADALVGWTVTLVEGGAGETTVATQDGAGGELLITTDAAENDGANLQVIKESFGLLVSGKQVYFGIRLKSGEATQSDFLVGLCITDTDLLGGMTDGVYFRKVDGSTDVKCVTEKNSTETESASVLTFVADTYYIVEFYFDGTSVRFYVNGTLVATHTTNIVDDELLTPSIHFLTGNAAAETMTVDWVRAIQIGR
jgi:hypothetical protein